MQAMPMNSFPPPSTHGVQTANDRLPALNGPLRSWLLDETSDAKAIEVISRSELLRGQAAMMLPALRAEALRPATPDEIMLIVKSREQIFGDLRTARTEVEWTAFWSDYFEALTGLTAASIETGMVAYIALPDSEWAPKPGKLAHLAKTTPTTGRFTRAYNRARSAVVASQKAAEPKPVVEERPSPEAVKAMVAETLKALAETPTAKAAAARKQAMKPTPSAPLPAGSHMSAEMRAKLEARKAILPRYDEAQYGEAA